MTDPLNSPPVFSVKTPEYSELVKYLLETNDESIFAAETPDELETTLQWCINKPTGLSRQVQFNFPNPNPGTVQLP